MDFEWAGFDWHLTVAVSKGRKLNSCWIEELLWRWITITWLSPMSLTCHRHRHLFQASPDSSSNQSICLRGEPLLIDYLESWGFKATASIVSPALEVNVAARASTLNESCLACY